MKGNTGKLYVFATYVIIWGLLILGVEALIYTNYNTWSCSMGAMQSKIGIAVIIAVIMYLYHDGKPMFNPEIRFRRKKG